MLVLLFVCMLLTKSNATSKATLRFYILCLCVMAFLYQPYKTGDLYRIYQEMDLFSRMDFSVFWKSIALQSSAPAARVLYWVIGKTGINALLPTFAAFACYSLLFYVILKTQELFAVSKRNVAYVLFFVMTTSIYISVIGGIRMMLALSLITFSLFRGTVVKKVTVWDILFYVLSVFFHAMAPVLILICFLVTVLDARRSLARKLAVFFVVGGAGLAFAVKFNGMVNNLYEKALAYIFGDKHSDAWEYIMGVLILALLVMLIFEYWNLRNEENHPLLRSCNAATIVCMVIAVIFCFEFSIFYRFGGQLAVMLSIPMMLVTLQHSDGVPSRVIRRMDFKSVLILMSTIIALISCTRGSLSSLKFFTL